VESPHIVFETKYGVQLLIFLRRQVNPLTTSDILEALNVRNWTAVSKTLRRLESAGLVTVQKGFIGNNRKQADLWRIEMTFGVKVAEALEEAQRRIDEASKPAGRPAIASLEPEEKLVTLVESAVRKVTGA
jgi:DNA-binding IscR family transcriptional regulator